MALFGPEEYSLWLQILGEVFLQSGLPNEARFACRCGDNKWDLRRKVLTVLATDAGLPNTAQFFWRPGDSESIVARKILVALGGSCVCGGDPLFILYRKILEQLRINSGLPNTPEFAFRPGDSLLDILRKILNNLQNAPAPPVPPFDECCPPPHGDWGLVTEPATIECDWGLVAEGVTCSEDWGTI